MPKRAVPGSAGIQKKTRADGSVAGYVATWRDPTVRDKNGESIGRSKTLPTLAEAKTYRHEQLDRIKRGRYINPDRSRTTWTEVSREWLEDMRPTLRRRTVEGYEHLLVAHLSMWSARAIGDISREDVRSLVGDIRGPRKARTVQARRTVTNGGEERVVLQTIRVPAKADGLSQQTEDKIFNVVRQVFDYAVEERYIEQSPASGKRRRRAAFEEEEPSKRALSDSDAFRIINALPAGRYRLFGLLAFWTGFRPGELAGLRVRSVLVGANELQVDRTVEHGRGNQQTALSEGYPKTKKSRWRKVPVPPEVMTELVAYIASRGLKPDDYVFAEQGPFFVYKMFERRQWQAALKAAGYIGEDTPRFYDLRHTFITRALAKGVPLHVVMYWAGHSDIRTTMKYTHVKNEDVVTPELLASLHGPTMDDAEEQQAGAG